MIRDHAMLVIHKWHVTPGADLKTVRLEVLVTSLVAVEVIMGGFQPLSPRHFIRNSLAFTAVLYFTVRKRRIVKGS